jgi:hypothetical protein
MYRKYTNHFEDLVELALDLRFVYGIPRIVYTVIKFTVEWIRGTVSLLRLSLAIYWLEIFKAVLSVYHHSYIYLPHICCNVIYETCRWINPMEIIFRFGFIPLNKLLHCSVTATLISNNLVDPASSHMLVSKIKPCMSQCKLLNGETANGSLKQL